LVHHRPEAWEGLEGHVHGEAAFRGYDGYSDASRAEAGEGFLDAGELFNQGVVVLLVVEPVGVQERLGVLGAQELHLARQGLADVGHEDLARDLTAEDLACGVAH
jgi:hypothetical protein